MNREEKPRRSVSLRQGQHAEARGGAGAGGGGGSRVRGVARGRGGRGRSGSSGGSAGGRGRAGGNRASGSRARGGRSRGRRPDARAYEAGARARLRRFRQGTALAVALTGVLLILWGVGPEDVDDVHAAPATEAQAQQGAQVQQSAQAQQGAQVQQGAQAQQGAQVRDGTQAGAIAAPAQALDATGEQAPDAAQEPAADTLPPDPSRAVEEATGTIRDLVFGFWGFLPKLAIALLLLLFAGLVAKLLNRLFRRMPGGWERKEALGASAGILVWLMAIGAALSVLAGDARALLGSVGLLGLALSWALQAPIESFAGWVLNSFRGYYRVGDRIAVGDVFGDVYRIDFLTTTVWEAGGPEKPVRGAQPTGASVTFPNSEVLRTNLVNYTRDFPWVWDEITVQVAHGSDLDHAAALLEAVAAREVGHPMEDAARRYVDLLRRERLTWDVSTHPQVFVADDESWTNLTVRYLVPSRERRVWSTRLTLAIARELALPENRERVRAGIPKLEVDVGEEVREGTGDEERAGDEPGGEGRK